MRRRRKRRTWTRRRVERLAALGYVGAPACRAQATAGASQALADPKDKLEVFSAVQQAGELMVEGRVRAAARALESALREEPEMPQALLMLGSCYAELGRTKEAKAQFDRVLKDDPQSVQAPDRDGEHPPGRRDRPTTSSRSASERSSLDERNTQAYTLLGDVYIEPAASRAKALPYLEKAVEIQPKLTQNRLNLAGCLIEVKQFAAGADDARARSCGSIRGFPAPSSTWACSTRSRAGSQRRGPRTRPRSRTIPDSFKARFNLGQGALRELGDWPGSIEQMREVVRIAPKRPEGYLFLARGLLHRRRRSTRSRRSRRRA